MASDTRGGRAPRIPGQPAVLPKAGGSRMAGRAALVTGAGAGIGAAVAHAFCAEGAAVLLADRDAEALARTAAALRHQVPQARIATFVADVTDAVALERAVADCRDAFGGLDTLVNNAAMRDYAAVGDATPAQWQAVVGVNLVGTANACRAALPALRASGRGAIVNVSSCYAVAGRAGMGLYDATKAAQLAMTRTLAHEEAGHCVRVNAVCPGSTLTDFHLARARAQGKAIETLAGERQDTSLLRRWADPSEIAWPILWLASDEASFVTGATLMVDGGLSIL